MAKVAVLGFGVVGSGVVEVLETNAQSIAQKVGEPVSLKYILDLRDFPESPYRDKIVHDFDIILNDPEVDVVCEVIGGVEPAYTFTKKALLAGKSVVTSNKELVAKHGAEFLKLAKEKNLNYLFEASVGGGIPIIRPLHQCLAGNEIQSVIGILNGTTNYILTQMFQNGVPFDQALAEAQERGYAERNPSADIDGIDACRKIAILGSLIYGRQLPTDEIPTEGISKLTLDDVAAAESAGYVIKLLGVYRKLHKQVYCRVSPCLISKNHPLSHVDDVFNGILVNGNAIDDVMFYGRGAGKLPTASAVVADIIDCVKHRNVNRSVIWDDGEAGLVGDCNHMEIRAMVRVSAENLEEARKAISSVFDVVTFVSVENGLAFITERAEEGQLKRSISSLQADGTIKVLSWLRVEE